MHAAKLDFGEFPAASEAEWRRLVEVALKGAPFDQKLRHVSADGLTIPLLAPRRADAAPIAAARGAAAWRIAARLDHPDPATANTLALEELAGGADALILVMKGAPSARGFGLALAAPGDFAALLAGIHADLVSLRLEAPPGEAHWALALGHWLKEAGYLPAALRVSFGLDPIGALPRQAPVSGGERLLDMVRAAASLAEMGYAGPFFVLDSRIIHDAGGSEAQELGFLAAGASYVMRHLLEAGFSIPDAWRSIDIVASADQDQVLTIAKLRALRLIFARIAEAMGLAPQPLALHVETAWRMLGRHDAQVNLLRNTIAAISAGLGGADSLSVLPHSAPIGLADAGSRRLARNISHILLHESHLAAPIDPLCGAGGIETLTNDLAEAGWKRFQTIEAARHEGLSGLAATFASGQLAREIQAIAQKRDRDIALRRIAILGASEFPNLDETPIPVLLPAPPPSAPPPSEPGPFAPRRLAEPFEARRQRASGLPPGRDAVFLAVLGRPAAFTPRANFAKAAFEAGGLRAAIPEGFTDRAGTDLAALGAAFRQSGAPIACLCGADADYAQEAEQAARVLAQNGAKLLVLAGRPGGAEAAWRAAGIGLFLHAGCDSLAFLDAALDACEAAP